MKTRNVIVVFQDCYLCGNKGRKKASILAQKGVILRKVGFSTPEGKELIHKAVFTHRIGSMPFYVEGDNFAQTLDELLEKKVEATKKTTKRKTKSTKKVEEADDGAISKD